jgi:DNA invertase Pin-like site-specific DNA recombinase
MISRLVGVESTHVAHSSMIPAKSALERMQDILRSGDVLAVWRLDRLGRSLKHLIELMGELEGQ